MEMIISILTSWGWYEDDFSVIHVKGLDQCLTSANTMCYGDTMSDGVHKSLNLPSETLALMYKLMAKKTTLG